MEELVGLHGYSNPLVGEELNGVRGWQCELPPALGTMWYRYVSCFFGLFWVEGVKEPMKGRTRHTFLLGAPGTQAGLPSHSPTLLGRSDFILGKDHFLLDSLAMVKI